MLENRSSSAWFDLAACILSGPIWPCMLFKMLPTWTGSANFQKGHKFQRKDTDLDRKDTDSQRKDIYSKALLVGLVRPKFIAFL